MVRCRIRRLVFETLRKLKPPLPRLLQAVEVANPEDGIGDISRVTKQGRGFSDWTDIASSFVYSTFPDVSAGEQERLVFLISAPQFVLALLHYHDDTLNLDTWYHNMAEGMEREPQEMLRSTKVFLNHLIPLLKEHLIKSKDKPAQNHELFNALRIDRRQLIKLRDIRFPLDQQLENDEGNEEFKRLGSLPTCPRVPPPDLEKLIVEGGRESVDRTVLRAVFYLYRAVEVWFGDHDAIPVSGKQESDQRQELIFLTTHAVLSYRTLSIVFKAIDLGILAKEDREGLLDIEDDDDSVNARAKAFLLSLGLARNTYTDDDDWRELNNWTTSLVGIVARQMEELLRR